jgi:REP element-mobilizing transposase RayT
VSTKYKTQPNKLYYVTLTVVGWIDVFTRREYVNVLYDSIRYCQANKDLHLHAYVVMTNHVHLICHTGERSLNDVLRDMKSFTAKAIVHAIASNPHESRKEWMLHMFGYHGRGSSQNRHFQFWQHGSHPIELYTEEVIWQKIRYLHNNPVKAGIVTEPEHYLHCSAHPDRELKIADLW